MQAARGASLRGSPDASLPGSSRHRRAVVLFGAVALAGYAVDVVTKAVAVARIEPGTDVEVVGDLLRFTLVRNPGAAFGQGAELTVLLSCLAIGAAGALFWFARRLGERVWAVGLGLLLAGVLGNLTDRLLRAPGPMRGEVIDFLRLPHWPVFNVADMCINAAAAVILVQAFRGVGLDGRAHGTDPGDGDPAEEPTTDPPGDRA